MSRVFLALFLVSAASALGAAPSTAHAAPSVAQLIDQLKTSDDFRVRTQAALALGATGEDAAVKPLCDALGDANASVKVASAAALGKLAKPAALPCLRAAVARETVPAVKAQAEKSIASIEQATNAASAPSPAAPPPPGPDAKFYVAIQINNKSGRPLAEVETIVRSAMQEKLLAKKGFAVAPKSETTSQGGQVVKSKKLKGFFLIATVEAPVYGGGDLSQVVRVSMWSYPDKSLQGEFSPKLTQSGTPKTDKESENVLMKMCAENAVESFQKVAATM